MYSLKERVVVLTGKYFGCTGTIVELGDKSLKVRLSGDPIKASDRIEECTYLLTKLTKIFTVSITF